MMESKTEESIISNMINIILKCKKEESIISDMINIILKCKKIVSNYNNIKQHIIRTCYIVHKTKENKCKYDTIDCLDGQIIDEIDYTCCICMFLFKEPMLLPCGHSFCDDCALSCRQKKCPLCRKYFSNDQLIPNNSISELINRLLVKCIYCDYNHEIGYKCTFVTYEFYCITCCSSNKMSLCEFANHYIICCLAQCLYCGIYDFKEVISIHENKCSGKNIQHVYKNKSNINNLCLDTLQRICYYLDNASKNNIKCVSKLFSKIRFKCEYKKVYYRQISFYL
jgi:hypothetical protein